MRLPFKILIVADVKLINRYQQFDRWLQKLSTENLAQCALWLRMPHATEEEYTPIMKTCLSALSSSSCSMIAHNHVTCAVDERIWGVHFSSYAYDEEKHRQCRMLKKKVGYSWHGEKPSVLDKHPEFTFDYVTISPVLKPISKPYDERMAIGFEGLQKYAQVHADLPLVALGGIEPLHIQLCTEYGAKAVAVCGALCRASEPGRVLQNYIKAF